MQADLGVDQRLLGGGDGRLVLGDDLQHRGGIHGTLHQRQRDRTVLTTSTDAPKGTGALDLHTTSAADKVACGNEVDFKDLLVKDLGTVAYDVYTTGENSALGNNMPSITFEIDPNVKTINADYSSLVYLPSNSESNKWTHIDATADNGKNWGLTGAKFDDTKCSINKTRCTWKEIVDYLGDGDDDAKVISAGISKGRDYAFSGAVDLLQFGGKTYDFEPQGVLEVK